MAQSWKLIDTITGANLMNIHFWDANNGIISGELNGKFLKTHDGGASWDTVTVPFLTNTMGYLTDMKFVDDKRGFVCGGSGFSSIQNVLIGTKDGGQTWDSLIVNWPSVYEFSGLDFILTNSIKGIVFTNGSMYKTLDSGKTLTAVNLPVTGFAFYVNDAVLVDNTIVLAGSTGFTPNKIYVSSDWGANWVNTFNDTLAITALGANGHTLYAACGGGWIIKSDNGGNSWTKVRVAANAMNFNRVKFGANDYVYLTANNSANNSSYIYGSDNNGSTWTSQIVDGNSNWMVDVSMPAKDTGYAIAYRRVYKTTNGGGLNLSVLNLTADNDGIQLYPNPTHNKLFIETAAGVKIKSLAIYDITGKNIRTELKDPKQINVSSLERGDYIIKIETDKCTTVKKLLVQ